MPALSHHLTATPVHDLRAIASRLGVASRALRRKPDFIQAILTACADPARRRALLTTLSPAAQGALIHLQRVAQTPAALFFAEYGPLRHARTQDDGAAAPWRTPATVTEELYYAALLGAADLKPLRTTLYLCTPDDLLFTKETPRTLPPRAPLHRSTGFASSSSSPTPLDCSSTAPSRRWGGPGSMNRPNNKPLCSGAPGAMLRRCCVNATPSPTG